MMKANKDPQAAILIEETYYYDVELAEISTTIWQEAEGLIRVQMPYDGSLLKEDASTQPVFHLGDLLVTRPPKRMQIGNQRIARAPGAESEPESLPVAIEAGPNWWHYIKSGKRAICQTEYVVPTPEEMLISIQGKILDFEPVDEQALQVTGKPRFKTPCAYN
jgi:hypothetical protein